MAAPAQQSPVDASTYPRVAALPDGRVEIHHPTILDWAGFRVLTGRAAVVVETGSEARRRVGSLSFAAATTVHFSQRLVEVSDVKLTALSFEGQAVAEPLAEQVRAAVARDDQWITLDFLLRSLPADFQPPGQSLATPQLRFDPPRVVVSERSMRLMLFDGPPVGIRIEGTDLEYIVNTDLDLFHDLGDDHWYLLDEGSWLGNRMLASGDWRPINNLPDDFLNLQVSGAWPQVAAALPPTLPANPPVPFTVSYEPAELVLIGGEARL